MHILRPLAALAAAAALSGCASGFGFGGGDGPPERKAPEEGRISILAFERQIEADAELAGRTPLFAVPAAFPAWTQPGGTASNAPISIEGEGRFDVLWRRSLVEGSSSRSRLSAPPLIADGRVIAMGGDQTVVASDLATGRRIWSVALRGPGRRDRNAFGGGVALADGTVFATSGYGFAVALDAASGRELWRTTVNAPFSAAPTVANGRVFAVTNDSELIAMDAATGAVQWTQGAIAEPARIFSASSPAVLADAVVAPFPSGEVMALLVANGGRLWVDALSRSGRLTSLSAINDIAGRPAVMDGVVYAASHSGILAAIDLRTGGRVWALGMPSTQTPWPSGDAVFVVTVDGELAALERSTGRAFWVTQLRRFENAEKRKGRVAWSGPLLVGGKLVLASSLGEVAVVAPENGKLERTVDVGDPVYVPPVAADGVVYLLTDTGRLVALK